MTRQLRALVLIVAVALVAFISSTLTSMNASDPRALPALTDGPSSTGQAAQQAFAERVRARFPLGTPERALMQELWAEGFEHPGDGDHGTHWASADRRDLACHRDWTVTWTTDDTGHLTAVNGTYVPSCL